MRICTGAMVVLGLGLCAACDDDVARLDAGKSRDASTAARDAESPFVCERETVMPALSGEPIWSASDAVHCDMLCPGRDSACRTANCQNYVAHAQCIADAFDACVTAADGVCRVSWEDALCCGREQCGERQGVALATCVERECSDALGGYVECADDVFGGTAGDACFEQARSACLLPDLVSDAGAPVLDAGRLDAATSDAGAAALDARIPDAAEEDAEAGLSGSEAGFSAGAKLRGERFVARYRSPWRFAESSNEP